ncbi:MAG TPA: M56 family metallopeptidase, partial [Pedobacter sp.]|nr:M56 family metallopeptidase [Pedobacter sp.]
MELFSYLLKVSACSVLFFAFYLLVLRKLTFFKINRFYLLFSVLLSFVIPALQITIEREVVAGNAVEQPIAAQDVDLGGPAFQGTIQVGTGPVSYEEKQFDWYGLLPYLYGSIVAVLLLLTVWRIYQLLKHTSSAVKEINGLKLVAKQSGFTNCSFFNYVFIDENSLTQDELAALLAHEEVHAKQYHSADKLVLMVAKAVLWFNPVIYLYDKALEQVHEYEADEATSQNIGTEIYATLLLKLAISKSSNPLIHNFVKSPIKQRIKMLFNSKSKNMKKLAYLLALPIGLGLIWGFTVKITNHVKPFVQQERAAAPDTLIGKTFKGKVINFEKTKLGEVLNLKVGNSMISINCYNFKDKVNAGDEISVTLSGKAFAPPPVVSTATIDAKGKKSMSSEKAPYMVSKVTGDNGKIIYETPQYAFLYEANRARYAWSKIKTIEKDANGIINKIVLNDKHGFTINLNVTAQQFKSDDFKSGDEIVVKFIGEKLTGKKTFTTDKMIALYSWPNKKYELINKELYPKFYEENGKQKVYNKQGQTKITQEVKTTYTPVKVFPKPILKTSSGVTVNNYKQIISVKDGVMNLFNGELRAKEIEINEVTGIITAKNAKFKTEKGKV